MTPKEIKEEEEWKLMHVLSMGPRHRHGLCVERCADNVCDDGCLNQKAKHFRPAIMMGIKELREQGDDRFPFSAAHANNLLKTCPATRATCSDAVCQVAGCLNIPAFHYRNIIKAADQAAVFKALKK